MAVLENITSQHTQQIKLNSSRNALNYTVEISNITKKNNKKFNNKIAIDFNLILKGATSTNTLIYKLKVNKRYFLNSKGYAIQKLNKAQQLANTIASLNNDLELEISKNFKLIKVLNTTAIRQKWEIIKIEILQNFPDLKTMVNDFDWQLKEENIQQLFIEDNFYTFFFVNIFNTDIKEEVPIIEQKIISNGIEEINIPITETKTFKFNDRALTQLTVNSQAKINETSKILSIPKLNTFIGNLDTIAGTNYQLDFNYNASYKVNSDKGIINKGALSYSFTIGDVYKTKTTIHFNLENNE